MEEIPWLALLAVVVIVMGAIVSLGRGRKVEVAAPKEERREEEAAPMGPLVICFGSQTGTAEQYAKTLCEEAKREGYAAWVLDLEDFEESALASQPVALFAMATYGEGEPTDNAHVFVKWAKTKAAEGELPLRATKFAVFGLGNTQYEHFNAIGKLTDALCEKLGGERSFELGLGDDDKDLDADFDAWRAGLWKVLGGTGAPAADDLECAFGLALEEDDGFGELARRAAAAPAEQAAASTRFYFTAQKLEVVASRELRSPLDEGSTRHVELATSGDYETADNLAILPENDAEDVAAVARGLGLDPKRRFALDAAKPPFPTPCSIEVALRRFCDLTHKPKRRQIDALLRVVDESPRTQLLRQRLDDPDWGLDTLVDYVDFLAPVSSPDASRLLAVFLDKVSPRLQPRYYTIASSAASEPSCVHVVSSLVTLPGGRRGVCTRYIDALRPGDRCAAFVRPSSFRPPPDPTAPLILVGPGTGVAPMRAIVRDVAAGAWPRPSRLDLYFGCKTPDLDHIYKDEMDAWLRDAHLDNLHLAYSRVQAHKVYVQHKLAERAAALADDLLAARASLFVCGSTDMGNAVAATVRDALAAHFAAAEGHNDDSAAAAAKVDAFIDTLKRDGRYVQELWA